MDYAAFTECFPESTEIGRDSSGDFYHLIFRDNGTSVGCWYEDKRTTSGNGEILSDEDAAACRDWCRRERLKTGAGNGR